MIRMIDERIRRKLAGIRQAFRGVVTLVNAAGALQLVQGEGLKGEPLQGVEYFQHFGFTSNMPEGTMFVTIPLGGKTAHCVIVGSEHADHRLKDLKPGESALYNAYSMKVVLTKDGLLVNGGGKPLTVENVSDVNITGSGKATIKMAEVDIVGASGVPLFDFVNTGCMCPLGGNHMVGSSKLKGVV